MSPIKEGHASSRSAVVIGVVSIAVAPAENAASSANAFPDLVVTNATLALKSVSLISRAAIWPSRPDMSSAMRTRSGFFSTYSSTARSPSSQTIGTHPLLSKCPARLLSVMGLPTTINTVCFSPSMLVRQRVGIHERTGHMIGKRQF